MPTRKRSGSGGPDSRGGLAGGKAGSAGAAAPQAAAAPERLHKVLAAAGLGSRRALEEQIRAGAVRVNGRTATLGGSVKPGDRIRYRDQAWRVAAKPVQQRTLLYNKPEGEVTTRSDEAGRPTVFDRLPPIEGARWVAVGRLDIATTGLLLLTSDGELAHAMMHPSNQVDREYVCRVRGTVGDEAVEALRKGVTLEDGPAKFSDIEPMGRGGSNPWFKVTLLEGRNREVRRLWASQGHQVSRLKRVRYGAARLPRGLRIGRWLEIAPAEHGVLREDVGLPPTRDQLTLEPGEKPRTRGTGRGRATGAAARPEPRGRKQRTRPGSPAGAGRRRPARTRKGRDR